MDFKKWSLILILSFSFLLFLTPKVDSFHGVFPLNLSNNISVASIYPLNTTSIRGTVEFNASFNFCLGCAGGTANITNISFILVNLSGGSNGGNLTVGVNRTSDLAFYSVKNSTVGLFEGNWSMKLLITGNVTPLGLARSNYTNDTDTIGSGHNFTIDNTAPAITLVNPGFNQTNTTVGFTFNIQDNIAQRLNCTLIADNRVINSSNLSQTGNIVTNASQNIFENTMFDSRFNYVINCDDGALDQNFGSNTASESTTRAVDTTGPQTRDIEFRDKDRNVKTEFGFSDEVTIDCNPFDNTTTVEPAKVAIGLIQPDIPSEQNISAGDISRSNTTLGETKLSAEQTQRLGDFVVICHLFDYVGISNKTNSTFKIIKKVVKGTSAFADPEFRPPVATKVVGVGSTVYLGELTADGVSRLISKTGSFVLNIEGKDYTITLVEFTDNSVDLMIGDFEVTVNEGEPKEVDVDGDAVNELEITLHQVFNKKGDLTFKRIEVEAAPMEEEKEEEVTREGEKPVEGKSVSYYLGVGLAVIIVVLLVFVILHFIRGRGEKIRFTPRDLGMRRDSGGESFRGDLGDVGKGHGEF